MWWLCGRVDAALPLRTQLADRAVHLGLAERAGVRTHLPLGPAARSGADLAYLEPFRPAGARLAAAVSAVIQRMAA